MKLYRLYYKDKLRGEVIKTNWNPHKNILIWRLESFKKDIDNALGGLELGSKILSQVIELDDDKKRFEVKDNNPNIKSYITSTFVKSENSVFADWEDEYWVAKALKWEKDD